MHIKNRYFIILILMSCSHLTLRAGLWERFFGSTIKTVVKVDHVADREVTSRECWVNRTNATKLHAYLENKQISLIPIGWVNHEYARTNPDLYVKQEEVQRCSKGHICHPHYRSDIDKELESQAQHIRIIGYAKDCLHEPSHCKEYQEINDTLKEESLPLNSALKDRIALDTYIQGIRTYYAQKMIPNTLTERIFGIPESKKNEIIETRDRAIAYTKREYAYQDVLNNYITNELPLDAFNTSAAKNNEYKLISLYLAYEVLYNLKEYRDVFRGKLPRKIRRYPVVYTAYDWIYQNIDYTRLDIDVELGHCKELIDDDKDTWKDYYEKRADVLVRRAELQAQKRIKVSLKDFNAVIRDKYVSNDEVEAELRMLCDKFKE